MIFWKIKPLHIDIVRKSHHKPVEMSKKLATIKTVAQKAGIGIETIRYYQRIGIIEEPAKPLSGYRVYPEATIEKLIFIRRAKELGFTLTEIASLLTLGNSKCIETKELATHKLLIIKRKINDLQAMANTLEKLIQLCESNVTHKDCPIITDIFK